MRHRHALLATATTGLLVASSITAVTNTALATTGCSVTYTVVSQWPDGFQGGIRITNLGDPLTSWRLGFSFPTAGQRVVHGWSADWSQSGAQVTATNTGWNGNLDTNQSVNIGFIGAWSGANPVPTVFTLNDATCTGSVTPTTPPPTSAAPTTTPPPTGPAPALRVSGNLIVTSDGRPYRLLGVNRSSGEYACVQGKGQWDLGPTDQASVNAMKTWNVRTVRLPLNEECWLGTNGSPSGANYQQGVKDYVNLLVANGINVILDLHWNWGLFNAVPWACTDTTATCQKPITDAQFAPAFWTGVANAFKGTNAVIFDLFNEPYPEFGTGSTTTGWLCLRDGGTCAGINYQVAGMQTLVNAVRATGATNIIMVGGLRWTNDLTQWLQHRPTDPTGNLVASWHSYSFNECSNISCWDSQIAPVAAQVPVVIGEMGADNCGYDYLNTLTAWATARGLSYLAWTWNPWGCTQGGVLIQDWNGTPVPGLGDGYKAHLLTQNPFS